MATVPTSPISALMNNTEEGVPASPTIMDAAIQALVDTINANWTALIATTSGASGAHLIGSANITGVTGNTLYAQLAWIEAQIQAIQAGSVPAGSITNAMLQAAAVSYAKLDTSLQGTVDTANKFRINNGIPEYNNGTGWKPMAGIKSLQKGSTTSGLTATTATVTAVDTTKAVVQVTNAGAHSYNQGRIGYAKLISSTQVEVLSPGRYDNSISTWSYAPVEWQLIEYY